MGIKLPTGPSDHPALVSREVTEQTERGVTFVDRWDLRHPQCPFVVVDDIVAELPDGPEEKPE
jgi:hypothetical protein